MADDVTVNNGAATTGTAFDVATDDDGSGNHVQIVKLAQSADGSRTAIAADSDGLLVNLGANNDVTVTSGTVTVTGVATSAKQDTGNTSVANVDTNLGAKADSSASTDTGSFSLIALVKRLTSKIPSLGSATGANSLPVVIASDQAAIAATVSGVATAANQTTANASLSAIDAGIPAALGSATSANSMPVVVASDQGAVSVTAAGAVASGASDSGNPVKAGGVYNSTKPTFTTGQRGDVQITSRGAVAVSLLNNDAQGSQFPTSAALADTFTNPTTTHVGADLFTYNGSSWDRARSDGTTGGQGVGGTVASGATDSGNPVKVSGVYNSTKPTYTNGQRGDIQIGSRGSTAATLFGADSVTQTFPTAAALADTFTNPTTTHVGADNMVWNGSNWDRAAGTAANGATVAPKPLTVRVTPAAPTISTSNYVTTDMVGTVLTFTSAASASGRAGKIVGASLTSRTPTALNGLYLHLFEASPTIASTDNNAFDLTDGNLESGRYCGTIDFLAANYRASASNAMCPGTVYGVAPEIQFVTSGSANLFGVIVVNGAPAAQYAGTTDLIVSLVIEQY